MSPSPSTVVSQLVETMVAPEDTFSLTQGCPSMTSSLSVRGDWLGTWTCAAEVKLRFRRASRRRLI